MPCCIEQVNGILEVHLPVIHNSRARQGKVGGYPKYWSSECHIAPILKPTGKPLILRPMLCSGGPWCPKEGQTREISHQKRKKRIRRASIDEESVCMRPAVAMEFSNMLAKDINSYDIERMVMWRNL